MNFRCISFAKDRATLSRWGYGVTADNIEDAVSLALNRVYKDTSNTNINETNKEIKYFNDIAFTKRVLSYNVFDPADQTIHLYRQLKSVERPNEFSYKKTYFQIIFPDPMLKDIDPNKVTHFDSLDMFSLDVLVQLF